MANYTKLLHFNTTILYNCCIGITGLRIIVNDAREWFTGGNGVLMDKFYVNRYNWV